MKNGTRTISVAVIRSDCCDARLTSELGQKAKYSLRADVFRFGPESGLKLDIKSWSQNLGHEEVLTTLTSYGAVEPARQAEIIRSMWQTRAVTDDFANRIAVALQQAGIVGSEITG